MDSTPADGPVPPYQQGRDPARELLRFYRTGRRPVPEPRRARRRSEPVSEPRRPGPELLIDLLQVEGVRSPRWEAVVGPDIAGNAQPVHLDAATGTLTVAAPNRAWAQQLDLLKGQLARRVDHEYPLLGCVSIAVVNAEPRPGDVLAVDRAMREAARRRRAEEQRAPNGWEVRLDLYDAIGEQTGAAARERERRAQQWKVPAAWLEGEELLDPPALRERCPAAEEASGEDGALGYADWQLPETEPIEVFLARRREGRARGRGADTCG
ncbi:DciA family protein [Kitasatospora sp. NPDC088134]|uniref:DciA family protein n=1 Tax=Kitasatospora sp. NPDC088134 TaxID=3364071 RepID=UPI0037F8A463